LPGPTNLGTITDHQNKSRIGWQEPEPEASLINSVLGEIAPAELGATDCHDHLFITGGRAVELEPDFLLADTAAATAEAASVLAAGGKAVLDCMPLGVGRDIDRLVRVSRETGLTVMAVSGFHRDAFYAADHWARSTDVDTLTGMIVSEATDGMGRSGYHPPGSDRSPARPAAITAATSGLAPTPLEATLLTAVGRAAAATGLPVITHTESVPGARWQLETLDALGVPAERVILSHMDRHAEPAELVEICRTGATVCLDWMGRLDRRPDEVIVRLAAGLVEAGLGDRVVLGQDLARRQYWRAYGGGPGMANLFDTVVPMLSAHGLGAADIDTILVQTPRRILARSEQHRSPATDR
jgi:phosphotriesterase-related protein